MTKHWVTNVAKAVFPLAPWKFLPPLHIIVNTALEDTVPPGNNLAKSI